MRSSSRDADSSFDALYRRYRAAVYRSALRDTGDPDEAEDVTQTTFLGAYRAFEHGRRPENPRQWLLAITRNICGRRFRARTDPPREVPLDGALSDVSTEEGVPAAELRAAFERLPESQLRVLVLREIRGLSYGEIGQQLGISIPAAQMLLFRARRTLRRELEAAGVSLPLRQGLVALLWRVLSRTHESPSSLAGSAGPAAVAAKVIGAAAIATCVVVAVGAPFAHRRDTPRPLPAAPAAAQVQQPVLHVERPRAAARATPNPAEAQTDASSTATKHAAGQPPPPTATRPEPDTTSRVASSLPLPPAPSAPQVEAPSLPPVAPPWLPRLDAIAPQAPTLPPISVPAPAQVAPIAPSPGATVPATP